VGSAAQLLDGGRRHRLPKNCRRGSPRACWACWASSVRLRAFTLATSNPFLRLIPAAADGATLTRCCKTLASPSSAHAYTGYVASPSRSPSRARRCSKADGPRPWARWTRHGRRWRGVFCPSGHRARQLVGLLRARLVRYWFWDPVENASFMPWLAGTGAHSLPRGHHKRGSQSWTLLLAILAFSMSLMGTFPRAHRASRWSVHSFAQTRAAACSFSRSSSSSSAGSHAFMRGVRRN